MKLSEQKFSLVTDIYNLKEKESKENQICKCRGVCNINHLKQNWKMSHSSEIFSKFKDLCEFSQNNCLIVAGTLKEISCTYCEQNFVKLADLGRHMKSHHKNSTSYSCNFCEYEF